MVGFVLGMVAFQPSSVASGPLFRQMLDRMALEGLKGF